MHPRQLLAALLLAATAPAHATLSFGVWAYGPEADNEASGDTASTPGWAGALRAGGQVTYYDAGGSVGIGTPGGTFAPNGSASVQPAFADPCPGAVLCINPAPVRAYGDISGQTGRFRGYASAEADKLANYAAGAGGSLTDRLTLLSGGALTIGLSLESVGTQIADETVNFAGTSFNYSLTFMQDNAVPGCGFGEPYVPCEIELARFMFVSGFDYLAGANTWGWAFDDLQGGYQSNSGTGTRVDLAFALTGLPAIFDVQLNGSVQADCTRTVLNGPCRATMDASNSAYLSLAGNFTSANGYQYLGRTAIPGDGGGSGDPGNVVPEPSSLGLLLAGFAVLGGVARQRRNHGSSADGARLR